MMQERSWASLTAAAALLVGAAAAAAPAFAANRWGADYFPNVALTTQDGKTVRFYEDLLEGKSVAINFIYTDCKDSCPLETANLVQLQRLLGERVGKDIFFYSISIDPLRDTPAVLKAYARKFGVAPGWQFLTGKPEDIKLIVKKLGMVKGTDLADRSAHHTPWLMLGDEPAGQWTKNSALDNPQFLAARIGSFLGWRDARPQPSYAEARPLALEKGQYLFERQCSACHSIGQGDRVGPDLAGVTARRERAWLTRYVQVPDEVLAAGDPIATALFHKYKKVRMPNLRLAADDVSVLLSYLEAQEKAPKRPAHGHQH
jgi:protein SCO1/2